MYAPEGEFFIFSEQYRDHVLDVEGKSKEQKAKVILYRFTGAENQRFKYVPYSKSIICTHSGFVFDICGGVKLGNRLVQYPDHNSDNQRFIICFDGSIRLDGTDYCLETKQGKERIGIVLSKYTGSSSQRWRIARLTY
eukprot:TRINITY_DN970_c0_g1_i2.p1 TRINITY_DN970_c0_g1~~TRINITY_DN970_c0_g1_i2.p1  ORF type:complete len:138 (-),score=12.27 TRINITY_DN970_c0_g1_i2:56-469(-)